MTTNIPEDCCDEYSFYGHLRNEAMIGLVYASPIQDSNSIKIETPESDDFQSE